MNLDIFNAGINFKDYFLNQLTLSSTLLGLIIATSTFILQSGFTSFEFSRSMFLKYYVRLSKFLFLLLGYNILSCLVFLYIKNTQEVAFILHIIFGLFFTKYFLDFYSHKGYIITLFSSKFNPRKNRLRKYLRYVFNLGFIPVVFILLVLTITIFYPISLGELGIFSEKQGFASTFIAFFICIISLIRIIPQYFTFSEQEYSQKENNELQQGIETDISQELVVLKDTLLKNGRNELKSKVPLETLNGDLQVSLANKKDEAFFVIDIWTASSNVERIVREIEIYSYDFFKELNDVHVDVNSFVLSYFIRIEGVDSSRTYFVRSKRTELAELFGVTANPKEFIERIKNKVIDELFRSV